MKDEYKPRTRTQILGYLVKECGEVIQAAGKTLRWGAYSTNPELPAEDPLDGETNREWILREILDLENAIALIREELDPGGDMDDYPSPEEISRIYGC